MEEDGTEGEVEVKKKKRRKRQCCPHAWLTPTARSNSPTGVLVAIATIIMGYDIRCFLCLLTSELCLLLWTFIGALTNRGPPPAENAPGGMFGVLKLAVGLVSPAASHAMGQALLVLALCGVLLQDLCVSLFSFVSITAVCLLLLP